MEDRGERQISRRTVLKGAAGTAIGAVAGVLGLNRLLKPAPLDTNPPPQVTTNPPSSESQVSAPPPEVSPTSTVVVEAAPTPETPSQPSPTQIPEVTPTSSPEVLHQEINGVKFTLDIKGMPIKYVLPDGKEVVLNLDQIEKVRQEAISSKAPKVLTTIRVDNQTDNSAPSVNKDHPEISTLPDDVVPQEKLAQRGVKIDQAVTTQLSVREGAFNKDGMLADFQPGGPRKLEVFLVDAPAIAKEFLADPKYDRVRVLVPDSLSPNGSRQQQVNLLQQKLNQANQELISVQATNDQQTIQQAENRATFAVAELDLFQNILTDQEIALCGNRTEGLFVLPQLVSEKLGEQQDTNTSIIFLAVKPLEIQTIPIIFDSSGNPTILGIPFTIGVKPLDNDISDPNPADFTKNPTASPNNPASYAYGPQTAGQSFRHELEHRLMMVVNPQDRNIPPNTSEYQTDINAMQTIDSAYRLWKESGNNSGYYFVFSKPSGGYILTDKGESNSTID